MDFIIIPLYAYDPDELRKLFKNKTYRDAITYINFYFYKLDSIEEYLFYDGNSRNLIKKSAEEVLEMFPVNAYHIQNKEKIYLKDCINEIREYSGTIEELIKKLDVKEVIERPERGLFYFMFCKELNKKILKDFKRKTGRKPTDRERILMLDDTKNFMNDKVEFTTGLMHI